MNGNMFAGDLVDQAAVRRWPARSLSMAAEVKGRHAHCRGIFRSGYGFLSCSFSARENSRLTIIWLAKAFRLLAFSCHRRADHVGHPPGGCLHRIVRQMRIAGGGLHLCMPKQLADHLKGFAESQCPGREGVSQVMNFPCRLDVARRKVH